MLCPRIGDKPAPALFLWKPLGHAAPVAEVVVARHDATTDGEGPCKGVVAANVLRHTVDELYQENRLDRRRRGP